MNTTTPPSMSYWDIDPDLNSARLDWDINTSLNRSPLGRIGTSTRATTQPTPQTKNYKNKKKRKKRKALFQKQPPPKQASLVELPDNVFHVVEMPDVAFRKDVTPKAPSTPSQEGIGFYQHHHRKEMKQLAPPTPPPWRSWGALHGRNQRRHHDDAGKRSSKPLSAHTTMAQLC